MNKITFSIIVPAYNAQSFLGNSLNSILNQTYQNFEIIIVNDGSTDDTEIIVANYMKKDSRINLLNQKNQGPLNARINGINNSKGDYIIFLDADDLYEHEALEKLENIIKKNNPELILYNYRNIDENNILSNVNKHIYSDGEIVKLIDKKKLINDFLSSYNLNSLWSKAIKREVAIKASNNIYGLKKLLNSEDRLHSLFLISNTNKIVYLDEPLYNYRFNQESTTIDYKLSNILDIIYVEELIIEYLKTLDDNKETLELSINTGTYYLIGAYFRYINSKKLTKKEKNIALNEIAGSRNFKIKICRTMKIKALMFLINHKVHLVLNLISVLNKKRLANKR